ncbi:PREDICTED: uncharacterized protein LOC105973123 [Erythranthe guttata]|uniref:uncharacterized protein LOC105973123 n=1 Tax=Erythranthe guttata TaxID=4155 RepID=UPI00064E1075|nr:PREDICTED: uncharacterized protein LOC105973123 [Erythranthe guttata]|eukprot:XP_012853598.1 PREDICTED: uncharacterized protein LOC105973123 [Erythranthe guttata]
MNTSFQQLSEIKPAIEKVLKDMQAYMKDISPLEKRLKSYFEDVSQYTKVKSDFTQRETQEMHEKSLSFAQRDLSEAELQESELVETANNVKAEILEITMRWKPWRRWKHYLKNLGGS